MVTRAAGQEAELARALESLGAEVLLLPVIRFAAPENWEAVDSALKRLESFDWVLFTSRNAVRFFIRRARERNVNVAVSTRLKVGAVGPATAETAREEGLRVDYVANDRTGESLARELAGELHGANVLLPRSDRADERLPKALSAAGAQVTEAVAYRTAAPDGLDPEILARVRSAAVDAMVFASPSAFENLARFIGASKLSSLSLRIAFAAIGPVTARAMREAGARVAVEAADPSAHGVAEAIAAHYGRNVSSASRSVSTEAKETRA